MVLYDINSRTLCTDMQNNPVIRVVEGANPALQIDPVYVLYLLALLYLFRCLPALNVFSVFC